MFRESNFGLVDIATQMRTHLPLVEMAMRHRVPTIVQKPFGQNIAEARRMTSAANARGIFLAVHENFRFQRPLLKIAEIIKSGAIGTPSLGRISFRTGYDIYGGQPYLAKEERFVLIDVGVHVLDVARVFLGEVDHLTAELQRRNPKAAGEDTATMLLRHTSGAVSMVECTYGSRRLPDSFPETLIEIEGDTGAIISRIGSRIEITVNGEMTLSEEDPDVLPWAERPLARGAGQRPQHLPPHARTPQGRQARRHLRRRQPQDVCPRRGRLRKGRQGQAAGLKSNCALVRAIPFLKGLEHGRCRMAG